MDASTDFLNEVFDDGRMSAFACQAQRGLLGYVESIHIGSHMLYEIVNEVNTGFFGGLI